MKQTKKSQMTNIRQQKKQLKGTELKKQGL
jgi:hypothetical protein